MISYLEKMLPEKKRSELKTIREYKNLIESHGVNSGAEKPVVPRGWTLWLENELQYCKKHQSEVRQKLNRMLPCNKPDQNRPKSNVAGKKKTQTINYGLTDRFYEGNYSEQRTEEAISLYNFEQALKDGGIHEQLFNAIVQKIDNQCTNDELRAYISECGSKKTIIRRKTLLEEAAKLMIANTERRKLIQMMGL